MNVSDRNNIEEFMMNKLNNCNLGFCPSMPWFNGYWTSNVSVIGLRI